MVSQKYAIENLGLTEKEYEKLEKWYNKQKKKRGLDKKEYYGGCIGGDVTFLITPTSIGSVIEAQAFGKRKTLRELGD